MNKPRYTLFFHSTSWKICSNCTSHHIKKNGRRHGKQLWKCCSCNKQFRQKRRCNKKQIWEDYTLGKQTHKQIGKKFGRSTKWVQRQMKNINVQQQEMKPGNVVIVMDTTYFKRMFGVMVWRCPHRKKNLLWKFLPYETIAKYVEGIEELELQGWRGRWGWVGF